MTLKVNEKGLIFLDKQTMTAIFDCVNGINELLKPSTKKLLKDQMFEDFIKTLLAHQNYNDRYRNEFVIALFPLFESTVGPMERNSDGTTLWLALGLAIKEMYGMRRETLKELLRLVDVKK